MAYTAPTNVSGSIVDYFKSKGLASDFETRRRIYEQAGLTSRYGAYTGSAEQNPAFLQYLSSAERNSGVSLGTNTLNDILRLSSQSTQQAAQPLSQQSYYLQPGETVDQYNSRISSAYDQRDAVSPTGQTEGTQGGGQIPQYLIDLANAAAGSGTPSADELARQALEAYTSSATYPLDQEAQEAEKAQLRIKAQQDKEKLISDLASRGLFFSGRVEGGKREIDAQTLADQFGIDLKYATLLASGLESSAKKIVSDAQKGKQDAINALSALGYVAVPGADGSFTIVQKPSETRAQEDQQLQREAAARSEALAGVSVETINGRKVLFNKLTGEMTDLGASGSGTSGDKLTFQESVKYGLPQTLVGKSELDIYAQLQSPTPPSWYSEVIGASFAPGNAGAAITNKWNAFRLDILGKYVKDPLDAAEQKFSNDTLGWFSRAKNIGLSKEDARKRWLNENGVKTMPVYVEGLLNLAYGN